MSAHRQHTALPTGLVGGHWGQLVPFSAGPLFISREDRVRLLYQESFPSDASLTDTQALESRHNAPVLSRQANFKPLGIHHVLSSKLYGGSAFFLDLFDAAGK